MNFRRDRAVLRNVFRPKRAATVTAAALGGCALLTACGAVQMGSAAIVGGHRITTSTLTTEVSDLTSYYNAHHGKVQLSFSTSQAPQEVLAWLIRFQVRDYLATRLGITVTPQDVQKAISEINQQAKESGGSTTLADLAVENGLPPNLINSGLGRYQAVADLLVAKLDGGTNPTSESAEEALDNEFNKYQCLAAKDLKIKVNPQFGRLDYSQLAIVASANTLSQPEPVPSPTSSTKPQYTPSC